MNGLLHTLFDGALFFNFYFYEKNKREIVWENMYNMIWGELFYIFLSFLVFPAYLYSKISPNIIINNRVILGIFMSLIAVIITTMIVRRIKKQEFCERVYSQFITMTTDVKKKKAWHGFYTNILPIVLYPASFFMILCLL